MAERKGKQLQRGDTFEELGKHDNPPIPNKNRVKLRKHLG